MISPSGINLKSTPDLKFMDLLEMAPDAMVIANSEGKIVLVNAQTERLFGYQREELLGNELELLMPERFRLKHIHHRKKYDRKPKTRPMGLDLDLFGKKKNGDEFPVEISLSPLQLSGNSGSIVIAAIRDITRQKEAETRIKQLNENLENQVKIRTQLLEKALANEKAAKTEILENQQRLAFLTQASSVINSSLNDEDTLNNIANVIVPDVADWCAIDIAEEDGSIQRRIARHKVSENSALIYELAVLSPPFSEQNPFLPRIIEKAEWYPQLKAEELSIPGTRDKGWQLAVMLSPKSAIILPLINRDQYYGSITLVRTNSGNAYSARDFDFAKEISWRSAVAIENSRLYSKSEIINQELEKRVAARTIELEAINKELEAFSYSVSHDLRAPLRSIDGFSNKLLKDYSHLLDETGKDYFHRVMNASKKMGHLIDDLLKLARLSRMDIHKENIDISALVMLLCKDLQTNEPDRKVKFNIQPGIKAFADPQLIQIALQNLVGNAWKYSRTRKETQISFSSHNENGVPVYLIKDNGVGFEMKYADKLFGAFQRLHSSAEFEGNGIGLATVKRIILRHHGSIWTDSKPDVGTTFYFTLPDY